MEQFVKSHAKVKPFSEFLAKHDEDELSLTLIYDDSDDQLHTAASFIRPCFLGSNEQVLWISSHQTYSSVLSNLRKQQVMPSGHVVSGRLTIIEGDQFFADPKTGQTEKSIMTFSAIRQRLAPFKRHVEAAERLGRGIHVVFDTSCLTPLSPTDDEFPFRSLLQLQSDLHQCSSKISIKSMFMYDTRRAPTASMVGLIVIVPHFIYNTTFYQNAYYYPFNQIRLSRLNALFMRLWVQHISTDAEDDLGTETPLLAASVSGEASFESPESATATINPSDVDSEDDTQEDSDDDWLTEDEDN